MSDRLQQNLEILHANGARFDPNADLWSLEIPGLSLEHSVKLGYELVVQLDTDKMYGPLSFPFEYALAQARKNVEARRNPVFGECRPDHRNLGVRVESGRELFTLLAEVKNDYEDHAELGGRRILKEGFLRTLTVVDLG